MQTVAKLVIGAGLMLLLVGAILLLLERLGIGSVPGDFSFKRGNLRVFVPLGTSIIVSIVLTLLLNLFLRRR